MISPLRSSVLGVVTRFAWWPATAVLSLFGVAVLSSEASRPVLLPLAVIVFVAAGFFGLLASRQRTGPVFHVGSLFGAIITLYCAFPLAIYFANGLTFGPLSDGRFTEFPPSPEQVGTLGWWYLAYLVPYCIAYLTLTRRLDLIRIDSPPRVRSLLLVVIALYGLIELYTIVLNRVFDLRPESYRDTYVVMRRLPLLVQQITGRLQSWVPTLQIIILTILFTRYRRYRLYVALLLVTVASMTVARMHARTAMFIVMIAAALLYHHLVRRIGMRPVAIGGSSLLILFYVLGALRHAEGAGVAATDMMWGANEFSAIFANVYDLRYVKQVSGEFLREPTLYFGDLLLPIPSQLVPFEKRTGPSWYMLTYYPISYESGEGMAFGSIAEAVVGFGVIEAVVRGGLIGFLFGWIDRRFTSAPLSIWAASFYVWLAVSAYHSFRSTSFGLITLAIQLFIVPVVVLRLAHAVLVRVASRWTGAGSSHLSGEPRPDGPVTTPCE
jgi:hypothetical protein